MHWYWTYVLLFYYFITMSREESMMAHNSHVGHMPTIAPHSAHFMNRKLEPGRTHDYGQDSRIHILHIMKNPRLHDGAVTTEIPPKWW